MHQSVNIHDLLLVFLVPTISVLDSAGQSRKFEKGQFHQCQPTPKHEVQDELRHVGKIVLVLEGEFDREIQGIIELVEDTVLQVQNAVAVYELSSEMGESWLFDATEELHLGANMRLPEYLDIHGQLADGSVGDLHPKPVQQVGE